MNQTTTSNAPTSTSQVIGSIPAVENGASQQRASRASILQAANELRSARSTASDANELIALVLKTLIRVPCVVAVSHFQRDDEGRYVANSPLICRKTLASEAANWEPHLADAVSHVSQSGEQHFCLLPTNRFAIACTPVGNPTVPHAVIGVFADTAACHPADICLLSHVAAGELSARGKTTGAHRGELDEFFKSVGEQKGKFAALAATLEKTLGVSQVVLGTVTDKGHAQVRSLSGVRTIKRPSPLATLCDDVMSEALLRGKRHIIRADAPDDMTESESRLIQMLRANRLIIAPLICNERPAGAWIAVDDGTVNATPSGLPLVEHFDELTSTLAGMASLLSEAEASLLSRVGHQIRSFARGRLHKRFLAACGLLALILSFPFPYPVRCDCLLQPVTRRFVPAPYEGMLQEVLVKPGDIVEQGQVLARMDKRDIEWQLAAQDAEYKSASKKHDTSMAAGDTASAQVAKLDMQRIEVERQMFRKRLKNLEIRSTIDGIILSGDPKELEGARLRLGQTLFECGPLSEMIAEVYVPDDEIGYVQAGQPANIRLDAIPFRSLEGQVSHVSPRAEAREGENVFVAEVRLDNASRLMRPGMAGRSRVTTKRQMLAWSLFRKPISQLIRMLRW